MALISVALPVLNAPGTLAQALACITSQTHTDLEVLVILNGSEAPTAAIAERAAREDPRVRILRRESPNLPAALNLSLREARGTYVARMDADDWCPPKRLERQAAFLAKHPRVAALGSAWEIEQAQEAMPGKITATMRPPTSPEEARWRLLLGNPFAHGSMMLRKDAVLAAGGYDEGLVRAQDYDLWIRLSRAADVCALSDVLYRHRQGAQGAYSVSPLQARHAAEVMLRAWRSSPAGESPALAAALAEAMGRTGGRDAALRAIESDLAEHPARESLMAWLWVQTLLPSMDRRAVEVCRGARVREVAANILRAGATGVRLWGAGAHCGLALDLLSRSKLSITGLVDNALAGNQRYGLTVSHPDTLAPGEHVLLASDAYEDGLWEASAGARARGVHVWRLYAD